MTNHELSVYGAQGIIGISFLIGLPVYAQEVSPTPTPFVIEQETTTTILPAETNINEGVTVQDVTQANSIQASSDETDTSQFDVNQNTQATIINPQVNTGTIINNVEQQNTVVVNPTPSPTPTPTPVPIPKRLPNEQLNFLITDDRTVTQVGDELTYRVVMRNFSDRDISEATIKVHIPEFLIPSVASENALEDPAQRLIYWRDVTISADSEVTLFVKTKVQPEVQPGNILRAVADINGPGVRSSAEDITEVAGDRIGQIDPEAAISYVPATALPHKPVPITAATGSESGFFSLISLVSGASIEIIRRRLSI